MKSKIFFGALWCAVTISAIVAFILFTPGFLHEDAAWGLSLFALCGVAAIEIMQKRGKIVSGCAMWTLRCLGTLLLAFMLRDGGLPLLSYAVFSLAVIMLWFTLICVIARLKQGWLKLD